MRPSENENLYSGMLSVKELFPDREVRKKYLKPEQRA